MKESPKFTPYEPGWCCACGIRHSVLDKCCPQSLAPSLEEIEKYLDDLIASLADRVSPCNDDSVLDVFNVFENISYRKKELIEMIKKFKEGK